MVSARFGTVPVSAVYEETRLRSVPVFNLNVAGSHAYLVGTNRVLVHNTGCQDQGDAARKAEELEQAERELALLANTEPTSPEHTQRILQRIEVLNARIAQLKKELSRAKHEAGAESTSKRKRQSPEPSDQSEQGDGIPTATRVRADKAREETGHAGEPSEGQRAPGGQKRGNVLAQLVSRETGDPLLASQDSSLQRIARLTRVYKLGEVELRKQLVTIKLRIQNLQLTKRNAAASSRDTANVERQLAELAVEQSALEMLLQMKSPRRAVLYGGERRAELDGVLGRVLAEVKAQLAELDRESARQRASEQVRSTMESLHSVVTSRESHHLDVIQGLNELQSVIAIERTNYQNHDQVLARQLELLRDSSALPSTSARAPGAGLGSAPEIRAVRVRLREQWRQQMQERLALVRQWQGELAAQNAAHDGRMSAAIGAAIALLERELHSPPF